MVNIIYFYALLKTLYDKGIDYIDSFWPFVMHGFLYKNIMNRQNILNYLKDNFNINMPLHVLDTVLERLKTLKYIKSRKKHFEITSKGIKHSDNIIPEKHIERKINSLIEDIYEFNLEHN